MNANHIHMFPLNTTQSSTPERCDLVVHSSDWLPQEIFSQEHGVEITPLENRTGYLVTYGEQRIVWLCAGAGGGGIMDSVLSATQMDCNHMLYLGGASALACDVAPGDLIVPNKAIHGGDPLNYLEKTALAEESELEARRTPPKGVLWVNKAAYQKGIPASTRTVFSAESRLALRDYLTPIRATGAAVVDRACSVFSRCMNRMGLDGASLLVVTDRMEGFSLTDEEKDRLNQVLHQDLGRMLLALAEKRKKAA